jgi:SSS family solute:Na+ symporter
MPFNATLSTAILVVYLLFSLVIGIAGWRIFPSTNLQDYLLANRGIGWFVGFFSTAASQFSALTMLGFIAFYYTIGIPAYLGISVAFVLFTGGIYYFIAPRVWKIGRKTGHITPSDLVRDFYDSQLMGYIVSVGMILALIPYLQVQFTGVGIIFTLSTGGAIPIDVGVIIIAVIVAIYTWLGGMKSVAWVDTFQGVMLLGAAFIGGIILLFTVGGGFVNAMATLQAQNPELLNVPSTGAWSWPYIITFSIIVFLGWIFHPHMWMRIHYFKSGRAVENLPWVVGGIFLLTQIGGWFVVLSGAVAIPNAPPDQFMLLMYREFFPTIIFAVVASAALAAMMSSASSQCHGIGAAVSRGISQPAKPDWDEQRHMLIARLATLGSIIAAVGLAFLGVPFLLTSGAAAASLATSLILPQAIAAVYGWEWTTKQGAIAGSFIGAVVALLFVSPQISGPLPSIYDPFWGVVANLIAFVVVSIVTASHPDESTLNAWREAFETPFVVIERRYRDRDQGEEELIADD